MNALDAQGNSLLLQQIRWLLLLGRHPSKWMASSALNRIRKQLPWIDSADECKKRYELQLKYLLKALPHCHLDQTNSVGESALDYLAPHWRQTHNSQTNQTRESHRDSSISTRKALSKLEKALLREKFCLLKHISLKCLAARRAKQYLSLPLAPLAQTHSAAAAAAATESPYSILPSRLLEFVCRH